MCSIYAYAIKISCIIILFDTIQYVLLAILVGRDFIDLVLKLDKELLFII